MSIVKSKRTPSKVEFLNTAYILNDKITTLLLRDFGIKRINRDLRAFTHSARMPDDDKEQFIDLCCKYDIDVETEYPLWLIEYYRDWILRILRDMINNIIQGNTVYITPNSTLAEFDLRRRYQWQAIACCYQLLQAMQTAIRILPVSVEKYMPYVDLINKELELLKAWKKSDNKRLKAIQAKQ